MNVDPNAKRELIISALNEVTPFLSNEDYAQMQLIDDIKESPETDKSIRRTIELLLNTIKNMKKLKNKSKLFGNGDVNEGQEVQTSDKSTVQRLLTHLESHVVLLEAISHNPELATLFLVGSNGGQSFNSIQKTVLSEQASRLRFFISQYGIPKKSVCSSLSDHRKNLTPENLQNLADKMQELNDIKESAEKNNDLSSMKNAFSEVCSLLETAVLFNDLLIHQFNNNDISKKNEELQKQLKAIKKKKDTIQTQLDKLKDHVKHMKQQNKSAQKEEQKESKVHRRSKSPTTAVDVKKYQKKIEKLENEKRDLVCTIHKLEKEKRNVDILPKEHQAIKNENNQLSSQIDLLNKQIANYQTIISQKDEKLESLKKKVDDVSIKNVKAKKLYDKQKGEVEELRVLYKNVTNQINSINDQNAENEAIISKLQHSNMKLAKDNKELKLLLQRSNETNQNQMKENALLIKQIQKGDKNEKEENTNKEKKLKSIINDLKNKLKAAEEFIKKLQQEIDEYRNSNSNKGQASSSSSMPSSTPSLSSSSSSLSFTPDLSISNSESSSVNKKKTNYKKTKPNPKKKSKVSDSYCIRIEEESLSEVSDIDKLLQENEPALPNKISNKAGSIMPSFDELEKDIKNLEISVKKTRSLVASNL